MEWEVVFTDEFGEWWDSLSVPEQESVAKSVGLLRRVGPSLAFPYCSKIRMNIYSAMRELRIQHAGEPFRALYL